MILTVDFWLLPIISSLDYIVPDVVHAMVDGKIVRSGDKELAKELDEKGYDWLTND